MVNLVTLPPVAEMGELCGEGAKVEATRRVSSRELSRKKPMGVPINPLVPLMQRKCEFGQRETTIRASIKPIKSQ